MGIGVHIELMNFLILLSYPNGLSCEECIQAAYDRGYEDDTGEIKNDIEENYNSIKGETKTWMQHYDVKTLDEVIEKSERGCDILFNREDEKAYFFPGKDKDTVKAWTPLHISNVCNDILRKLNDGAKYQNYLSISEQEPEGWKNHQEQILLFYLQKFPGKSAQGILIESGESESDDWPPDFVEWLKELRIPVYDE